MGVIALAALMLGTQLLAAAHVHRTRSGASLQAAAQVVVDNGLCALCLFHYDSPASASSTPLPARPALFEAAFPAALAHPLRSVPETSHLGRAPPLTL